MNIFNIKSISFEEIRNKLYAWLASKPNLNSRWRDFYVGGAGSNLVELAAAIGAFLAYSAYMNRRDSLLEYTTLGSSATAIGSSIGYIYNRKVATGLRVKFLAHSSAYLPRETVIGSYKSHSISLKESVQLRPGLNTLDVVFGAWKSQTQTVPDTKDFISIMFEGDVDNKLYELYTSSIRTPVVLEAEELNPDNALLRSFEDGVFVVYGNGHLGKQVQAGQTVELKYLQPSILNEDFLLSALQLNLDGDIEAAEITEHGSMPDSIDKIKAVAPAYHASRRILTGLESYKAIISAYQGNISGSARPFPKSCCKWNVCYLRKDEKKYTPEQELEFIKYLSKYAMYGSEFIVVDPVRIPVRVKLRVVVSELADTQAILAEIRKTLEKQCLKLDVTFSPGVLHGLETEGIRRLYLEYPIADKTADYNQYFALEDLNVEFTTDNYLTLSNGTDAGKGYD